MHVKVNGLGFPFVARLIVRLDDQGMITGHCAPGKQIWRLRAFAYFSPIQQPHEAADPHPVARIDLQMQHRLTGKSNFLPG